MSFWAMTFAVVCGMTIWDILIMVFKISVECFKDCKENKERKIGFGDDGKDTKKAKGAQMRKIGFGAND